MAQPKAPTAPLTLRKFFVKRAGGRMTAHGTDIDTGLPARITNIDRIIPPDNAASHHVLAVDKNGIKHRLIFA